MDGKITEVDYRLLSDHSLGIRNSGGFAKDAAAAGLRVYHLFARKADRAIAYDKKIVEHSKATGNPILQVTAVHTGGSGAIHVPSSSAGNLEANVFLAVGAPVMCSKNVWLEAGLVNGAMGIVHEIVYAEGKDHTSFPEAVLVKFDEKTYKGPSFLENVPGVVKFSPSTEAMVDASGTRCTRTQFPLQLAFALTIHKS
jgi:ATP-dependent exoDNAse (exonuclease V) alpha subunit